MLSTKYLVPKTWYQMLGSKYFVPNTWYQIPGTKYLVPQVLVARYSVRRLRTPDVIRNNNGDQTTDVVHMILWIQQIYTIHL